MSKSEATAMNLPLSENDIRPNALLTGQREAFARDVQRLQRRQSEFVTVNCPACFSSQANIAFKKYDFSYLNCKECLTLYMSPRPTPAIMTDYYTHSENYAYWAEHIFPASEAARREKIHKPWLERVRSYCKQFNVPQGMLVEVGPGFGTFSALASDLGVFDRVVAIEPTPELANACRKRGVEVVEKRIEDVRPEDLPPADVMVSFEVIEHLFEPRIFLEQCWRTIRPGGLLVLSCPNGRGFDISMLQAKSVAVDPEHVNLFNPASLSHLLHESGFDVLLTSTPGQLDAELVRDAVLQGQHTLDNPFLKEVLLEDWERLGQPFQQFLAENELSAHMWIVARKPDAD